MSFSQSNNIQPKRILVITLRYLGDTLLTTPLLASLKQAYPHAEIDVLLPFANQGMLQGNPHISRLIPIEAKPKLSSFVKLLLSLYRRYDLSISTQPGDRPVLCAITSGRFSMGFVPAASAGYSWKRLLLSRALPFEGQGHAVLENLRFCRELDVAPCYALTPPRDDNQAAMRLPRGSYAVMHIMPQWRYKQWQDEAWIKVANFLSRQGLAVVLTGSASPSERQALRELQRKLPPSAVNLSGQLTLPQLTALIEKAVLFIGPDTGVTHLAAATGAQTFALFGPTDPKIWAPWPSGYAKNWPPFAVSGTQDINNVHLIQKTMPQGCVPCQLEGCERNQQSRSACLDELSAESVIEIIGRYLFRN